MRKLIVLIISTFIMSSLYCADVVKIGIFSLPPFMMEVGADKKPGGAAVDYWKKYIAPKMGVDIEVLGPFPLTRATKMLEDGEIDVITNTTKVPAREALFIYPETEMSVISSCLVVLNDSPLKKVAKSDDLFNMKIGFIEGGFVPPLLKNDKITIEFVTSNDFRQTLLDKLEGKRNDAFLDINYMSLLYDLKLKGFDKKVRTILLPVDPIKVYSIFQKSDKGQKLAKKFDEINKNYYKTDTYVNLAKEYLK